MIFYRAKEIKDAVKSKRLDTGKTKTGGGGHAFVSDPTAMAGIAAATEVKAVILYDGIVIRHPEKWLQVVDSTYKHLDSLESEVAKSKYSHDDYRDTCTRFGIGQSTYYCIINDCRIYAKMAACQLGLIRVL